jgi:lactoylglutathione lyase
MANRKKAATRSKSGAKRASSAKKAPRAKAQSKGLTLTGVAPSFTVDDLQKSIAWYQDVLGFVVKDRWESDGKLMGVELGAGTTVTFMLGQDDWKKGRDRAKGQGFRLYCETTQDVDRLADQIKARGGTLTQEPEDADSWGARLLAVEDPDGFTITIFKKKGRRRS